MKAPLPANEAQRLVRLRAYEVLDTPSEAAFDDLTLLAAQICGVPTAMVSLVDEKRPWFKSKLGISATETSRDVAFCAHTILRPHQVLEVRDAEADPRFADSPLVKQDPHIRFYAGAPLVTADGHALGALCVMDAVPRNLTVDHILPASRGGPLSWMNTVAACRACNGVKADRTPEEARMPLLFTPYVPSRFEDFLLKGRRIRADVHDWLAARLPKESRLN